MKNTRQFVAKYLVTFQVVANILGIHVFYEHELIKYKMITWKMTK